jgi:hypothetical protein
MWNALTHPVVQLVVSTAGLCVLILVGWYIVRAVRDDVEESETTSDLLSKFTEMRQQGYLQEEEFRNIRTHLGEKLRADLKRDEQGG